MLALLLLGALSVERWQASGYAPSIDFLTVWSVPHVVASTHVGNIYARDDQLVMGTAVRHDAAPHGLTEPLTFLDVQPFRPVTLDKS